MSGIATAIVGGSIVTGMMGANAASDAASTAAGAQTAASDKSIAESQRQFDAIQKLLSPYTNAGTTALAKQQALIGLGAPGEQQSAIDAIANGSEMKALTQQGENALLQNASATGGLRGGNLEGALAQFRPQMLNSLINQQYDKLGGLTSIGQNAAAMTGNAGQNSSSQIINALQQTGAAQAGSALASGQAQANMWGGIGSSASTLGTLKLLGKF